MNQRVGSFVQRVHAAGRKRLASAFLLGLLASTAHAATLTVSSAGDAVNASDGVCTLREAIVAANANAASGGVAGECSAGQAGPTVDVIAFAIPGAGVHAIVPVSALPAVTEAVTIDGYTQAGSSPNTQATGGSDAVLQVALDGTNAGAPALLRFAAGSGGSEVRGLVLGHAQATAIHLAAPVRVAGNFIGTDATGAAPAPNAGHGVEVVAPGPGMIGGTAAAERNVIAFNGGAGVRVDPAAILWRIVGNAMAGNGKGIALADDDLPLANDVLDADGGANERQNFPLIDSVTLTPTSVRVQGRIEGAPARTLLLDVYGSAPPLRPGSFLQGETYLGTTGAPIVTDAQGRAAFDLTLPVAATANLWVTATLTDATGCFAEACGNTSEFSQRGVFLVLPRFGSGALPVTVTGQLFAPGSSFALGATPALGQGLVDAQTLTGILPPLNPGTLYDVTVTYPDASTATMLRAFATDFADVGSGSPFYPFVMSLAGAGITSGCVAGQYCGSAEVSRAQMALFLVRGLYGPFFTPPPASGVFADVPLGSFAVDWIEQFYTEGITSGCANNPLRFCPNNAVTRGQMAVFMLRAKHGSGYVPPPCTGLFADVSCTPPKYAFADWIEQLAREGITSGCASNPLRYCPEASVLRLQMAVFLTRVLGLSAGNAAPAANAGADQAITLPAQASLTGGATDDGLPNPPGQLTYAWTKESGPGAVTFGTPNDIATSATFSQDGVYVLRLTVSDGALDGHDDVQVTVNPAPVNQAPQVNAGLDQTITLPAQASLSGSATDDGLPNPPGQLTYAWTKQSGPGTVVFGDAASATTTASFSVDGVYVLRLTVSDSALSHHDDVQVTVQAVGSPPVLNPPPIDPTVPTTLGESTEFLYIGPNPVQTGVAPGTIDAKRVAVLRGRVIERSGTPLSGVTVKVNGRAQFGQTLTRADGRYDMAVNGGGVLTVDFSAAGRFPVQRTLTVPWRDYVNLPDVAMVAADTAVTTIAANGPAVQVHQATQQTDTSGTRRASLLFPPNTGATIVLPGGGTQPLATMNVRATEYTVGPNGPAAMPGLLPPTSAYTYAVELSVDQAVAAGAKSVQFTQPVPVYVDNFLDFPAGTIVPAGVYDRDAAQWVAMPNGIVAKLVSVTGGAADLDVTGDGVADDPATELAPLGITLAERQALATLYSAGQSFWRTPTTHFSSIDYNMPYAPPNDAKGAGTEGATSDESVDRCMDEATGSIIECQNQILGQSVGIVGTPFTLNYRSDRVPGREIARTIDVAASGASIPASLKRIEFTLSVAGQEFTQSLPAAANQRPRLVWDGKDAYGRTVQGRQTFGGTLDYVYDAVYTQPMEVGTAFAQFGGAPITSDAARMEYRFPQVLAGRVGIMDARGLGVGGWTLSPHHSYDADGQMLHHGSGKRLSVGPIPYVTTVVAGSMTADNKEFNNLPATSFALQADPIGIVSGPDGSFYFTHGCLVRKVGTDGILTVVAGTLANGEDHVCGYGGDGGPASLALFDEPTGLALGPDGSLYVADSGNNRVRRIDPSGIVTTIAGNGTEGFSGDGGLAVNASIDIDGWDLAGVAAGGDGSVYVADVSNNRIRRIDSAGVITTIGGGGSMGPMGCEWFEGVPATQSCLFGTQGGIAVGPDGTVYLAGYSAVLGVRSDGTGIVVAGNPFEPGSSGDGGLARLARLDQPIALAMGADGSLYIGDSDNDRIRRVSPGGIITTFAGGGDDRNDSGIDGVPATQLDFRGRYLFGLAIAPDNSVLSTHGWAIRRYHPPLPDFLAAPINVASSDGGLLFQFDALGRHLRTRHVLTGAVLHEFGYDGSGRLTSITEKTGGTDNVTTIQRNAGGHPTAIVGPFGQMTNLGVDANGFVDAITSPAAETHAATYTPGGLMQSFTKPGRPASTYLYDAEGRLTRADDPAGGFQTLTRTVHPTGHEVARTTALGQATQHWVENIPTGEQKLTRVAPDATQVANTLFEDGMLVATMPGGMIASTLSSPDPRFGMQAPVTSATATQLPSALTMTESGTRSVVLSDPANVLSLVSLSDMLTVNNRTTSSAYTVATRTNVLTTPAGRSRTVVHDALGRVVSTQVAGLAPTSFAYDDRGRMSTIVQGSGPGSRSLTIAYNAQGFVQSVTDGTGRSAQYTHDANGRVTSKSQTGVGTVAMTYDAAGELSTLAPPGRPAHAFVYDPRGNFTSVVPPTVPGAGPSTFAYDADGRVAGVARAGGESVSFAYDAGGRLASLAVTSIGLPVSIYTYAYDAAGRPQSVTGPGAQVVQHAYDGPLVTSTAWSGPFASSVAWTYDNAFRVATETVAGTAPIVYAYDADDLLTAAGSLAMGRSPQNGLLTSSTLATLVESYSYNAFGEPAGRALTASGTPLFAVSYVRDESSRIVQKQETIAGVSDTYDYTYDPIGQLLQVKRNNVVSEAYVYDANGNRTSATLGATTIATFDDQDRLLSSGSTTFVHSAAGKLQSKSTPAGVTIYRYDALGNLVDVVPAAGSTVSYRLDGWDRRVQRLVGGVVVAQYVHAGDRIVAELDPAGTVVSRFVYAGARVPAYMIRGGATYRLVTDLNGSVRLVIDAATGAIAQRIDYDAFGRIVLDTNPSFQPFAFAGGLYDPATGLVRFGARDYDPQAGRWTVRDPIGFGGGDTNLYRYAFNDPVNLADPSGLFSLADVSDFVAGAHESVAFEVLVHNPMQAAGVVVDGLARAAASALGHPVPGPSMYDRFARPDLALPEGMSMIDRDSGAYDWGQTAGALAPACIAALGAAVGAGVSAAVQAGRNFMARHSPGAAAAREIAESIANRETRRAQQAAAEQWARNQRAQNMHSSGSGNGTAKLRNMDKAAGKVLKK